MRFHRPGLAQGLAGGHPVPCLRPGDPAIRKTIHTTNEIEGLNRVIRRSIKTRGSFPTKDAATKLIYLTIRTIGHGAGPEWFAARNHFARMFEDSFNAGLCLKPAWTSQDTQMSS